MFFGELPEVLTTKANKCAIRHLFQGPEMFFSASDEGKLSTKIFSKKSYFDNPGITLPIFSSRYWWVRVQWDQSYFMGRRHLFTFVGHPSSDRSQ